MKGDDPIKPAYAYYTDKMWRYFIPRWKWHQEHGTTQTQFHDAVEMENYTLCAAVWDTLTEQEREIQCIVHCTTYDETDSAVKEYAAQHGMRTQSVWSISHNIGKELGVKKGLVPDKKGGNF